MGWFLKLIGVGDAFTAHMEDTSFDFHHWEVLWIGLALLVPVTYFIFVRQQRNLRTVPFSLRLLLTSTRALILALLVVVLAGPYVKLDERIEEKPIVAVLLDHSRSMELPAGPFPEDALQGLARAAGYRANDGQLDDETRKQVNDSSRAKLVQNVLMHQGRKELLQPLAKTFDLRFYSFAQDTVPVQVDAKKLELPEPPGPRADWGNQTRLRDALRQVLADAAGRKVAGVIVFSDGQETAGRFAGRGDEGTLVLGMPVFAVPAGTATVLPDLSVVDVFATSQVAVGEQVRVVATVKAQGFPRPPVKFKVQLLEDKKILDTRDVALVNQEEQRVELTYTAREAGGHVLKVHIPPLDEEPEKLRGNNTDYTYVQVGKDRLRVLYVEGLPRWDFRFLKNAMRRDHGLGGLRTPKGEQPDIILEAEPRGQLPTTLEELARYHTVILGDASSRLLTPQFLELLAKAVREKGVGLVVQAGPLHMPHELDKSLLDLLPVRLLRRGSKLVPGLYPPDYKPFVLELSPMGVLHDALRLYPDSGHNLNAWRHMPPFYWSAATSRLAPAATVLAQLANAEGPYGKRPVIAYQHAGEGKVMFVGTDSTWLWRQNVGDRYFYRFWGQTIRFVARREQAAEKQSWIEVWPHRAQPGEKAVVELMAFGPNGAPVVKPEVTVQVRGDQGTTAVKLLADRNIKGRYTGNLTLEKEGSYRVAYQPGGRGKPVEARVRVLASVEELRRPDVNREALRLLARNSAKGQLVELTDLGTIPEKLTGQVDTSGLHREADVWDNWLVLGVLIFLYTLDVGLRRLAGLS